jgi:hypothetical protein
VPNFKQAYLSEIQFKQALEIMLAEQLHVRQLDDNAYSVVSRHIATATDYVLATARSPDMPRTFTHLGRCVQFAVLNFGIKTIRFELLDAASDMT